MIATHNSVEEELIQTAAVAVAWLEARGYTQQAALTDVRHERFAQVDKWGIQVPSDYEWLTILAEEFGEIAHALLEQR